MTETIFDKKFDELTMEEITFEGVKQIKRIADAIQDQNDFYMAETAKREAQAEEARKASEESEASDAADGAEPDGSGVGQDDNEVREGI